MQKDNENDQTIVLDAPPFSTRPDELLPIALKGTSLPPREANTRIFGAWEFDYSDIDRETWSVARKILQTNITELYNQGLIRYGSW